MSKSILLRTLIALAFFGIAASAYAVEAVNQSWLGVAIKGYDPVAYFAQGKPVKGDDAYTLEWNGAKWHFASEANKTQFQEDPEKYAPQYGGYCAWAVSQGYTASIDPNAWKIVRDKLYLNYSKSVQQRWEKDIPGHIQAANDNWPKILQK